MKGKLRHLLEYVTGAVGDPIIVNKKESTNEAEKILANLGNVSKAEKIVRIFGIGADDREDKPDKEHPLKWVGLTRLTVRDAFPDDATKNMWEKDLGSDANYTEYKAENTIDRLTSAANPRFIERVVEGSVFDFEMVYTAYQMKEDEDFAARTNEDIKLLMAGLRLLENTGLGKSGSRGYGKISFHLARPVWITQEDYIEGTDQWKNGQAGLPEKVEDLTELSAISKEWFQYPA